MSKKCVLYGAKIDLVKNWLNISCMWQDINYKKGSACNKNFICAGDQGLGDRPP